LGGEEDTWGWRVEGQETGENYILGSLIAFIAFSVRAT
jgi:hypothetical protein